MISIVGTLARRGVPRYSRSLQNVRQRCFSSGSESSKVGDITGISLSQPVSWLPIPRYATVKDQESNTHITRLENGLTVASAEQFGNFCTVGVLIDSGSRYEGPYPSGITHFLEKLSFSSTAKFANKDEILQRLEEHGGVCDCQGSRDTLIYAASASTTGVAEVVELLSEAVLQPKITLEELEATRAAIGFELDTLDMKPDPDILMVEYLHAAAYWNNTLGLPKVCPQENLSVIDRELLYTFMSNYHTPKRMVLAGVGIKHEELLKQAEKYFVSATPAWKMDGEQVNDKFGQDLSISQYTGGIVTVEKDLSNVTLGPSQMPELTHFIIGLEGCSHEDPDFVSYCVLHTIMGGGGSFSAGGPGKGMYTRLYTNVLNRHHWMHNAMAQHHAYRDSGIFAIQAAAAPSMMRELVEVIAKEFVSIRHGIGSTELERAKTQLQSILMMNLEMRAVVFEDIGRQVLASGKRYSAQYFYDKIAKVTEADVIRVADRMLASKVSVAFFGDLSYTPTLEEIQKALHSKDGRIPRKFSLFK
ncbi:hypothetical protein LSH36_999g00050 [Paralvinella palmiformis]|uniref:Mitochondrial-processing peptidase subunit alpha n=1 Tax=Paralvinella palmiformis TaxID=53620 RepID=A0AAD9MS28_9ANNE|nr:hypothetical protein LSH36_999g00050 [Paralvinella palmiformis]